MNDKARIRMFCKASIEAINNNPDTYDAVDAPQSVVSYIDSIEKKGGNNGKTKALFTLTMPGVNTWNGHWSGDGKLFCKERTAFMRGKAVFPKLEEGNYGYDFGDGWFANVNVKFVTPTEAKAAMKRSQGFCGYEWMIDDLCRIGRIRTYGERH